MNKLLGILSLVIIMCMPAYAGEWITCASTTSTQNSGLFDHVLPIFEAKSGITVHVIAQGTGAAIETGKRGDADLVFVHAKDDEMKAVQEGFFIDRHDVMYNDFVIVGPKNDPAGVKAAKTAIEALTKIAASGSAFVSRGDNSGTHKMEQKLWKQAGADTKAKAWYLEVGQGMEKTQRIANEKRGYTLTDRGTWLAKKDELEMAIVFEGDPVLFNQYGVMAVNPAKWPKVKYTETMDFIKWLISKEGQDAIASYKDKNGLRLFYPNAK